MSRIKSSLIVFEGKFREAESILELRAGTTENEWFQLVKETIDMYCYMSMAKTLSPKIERKDAKIIKRLKETIELIKTIDPTNMSTFDLENVSEAHTKLIKEQWQGLQKTVKIAHDQAIGNADIYISGV